MKHYQNSFLNTLENLFLKWPCHRYPERSLIYRGRKMPVCARCFGIILGFPIGIAMAYFGLLSSRWFGLLFLVPLLVDGGTQQMGNRTSNNSLRTITGLLAGLGLGIFILMWIERDLIFLNNLWK